MARRIDENAEFSAKLQAPCGRPKADRRLACPRCGTEFSCGLSGPCWCAEETARLPMPVDGQDCLCRECLRKMAAAPNTQPSLRGA